MKDIQDKLCMGVWELQGVSSDSIPPLDGPFSYLDAIFFSTLNTKLNI